MNFNYTNFEAELKKLTGETFNKCLQKLDAAQFSGFALYSDESAMSISVSCNTQEHLKEALEEEKGHDAYFKWTPGEWKYEMVNSKAFETLNGELSQVHLADNGSDFLTHRNKIFRIAVKVLSDLKIERLFRTMSENFVLMFAVSDFSEPEFEIEFVKMLNTPMQVREFEEWIIKEGLL